MAFQTVDILGEDKNKHNKNWFVYWRPQIENLMSGSKENYVAALMLMIPCMERVYTLKNPDADHYRQKKHGKNIKPVPIESVFKEFFTNENPQEYDQIIRTVAIGLANGLKHDSFIRDEIHLSDELVARHRSGVTGDAIDSAWYLPRTQAIVSMKDGRVAIAPSSFWIVVRRQIDKFYLEDYPKLPSSNSNR